MTTTSVAILMCTYNGQSYLSEQLESFTKQTHQNWQLWVSDDGSEDETLAMLDECRVQHSPKHISILNGPQQGSTKNFFSLVCHEEIEADYFAYSDQDDIWDNDKLERGLKLLEKLPKEIPSLYCSRTRLVDEKNNIIGFSPLFTKPPNFANALTQNIGGGNTMVFNKKAREILIVTSENSPNQNHDWWTYLVISAVGGNVIYDPNPTISYRQHSNNQVGMNSSFSARLKRIYFLLKGQYKIWNDNHLRALAKYKDLLPNENLCVLDKFTKARKTPLFERIKLCKSSGIYRQTFFGNLGLLLGIILNKV